MAKPKLKLGYDNVEDAKNKLQGGLGLYKGKTILIKGVGYMNGSDPEEHKFGWYGSNMAGRRISDEGDYLPVDDPDLNVSDYNIGYMNAHGYSLWWYRIPYKQYHQALRNNQVTARASNPAYLQVADFKPSNAMALMLENKYPNYSESAAVLQRDADQALVAFHKNFAMSLDKIHGDYIIEYKGQQIGFTSNLSDFKLMKEHEHLYEALQEAIA